MSLAVNEDVQILVDGLCAQQKLLRDKELANLKTIMKELSEDAIGSLIDTLINILENKESPWESMYGSIDGLTAIFIYENNNEHTTNYTGKLEDPAMKERLRVAFLSSLTAPEVRVRNIAGTGLGALCRYDYGETYLLCRDTVLDLVRTNLQRQPLNKDLGEPSEQHDTMSAPETTVTVDELKHKLQNSTARERRLSGSRDQAQILHDTAGWKNLESSLSALKNIIEESGSYSVQHCNEPLVNLILGTLTHPNRFVRETGFGVCAALGSTGLGEDKMKECTGSEQHASDLVQHLALGLADNWSQVRYAASVATRKFLMNIPEKDRGTYFPALLPRVCLNRYYVAEGVRGYSQETWRQVTSTNGRDLVQRHIADVVSYYVESTSADNHAVREAACACIAELVTKMPTSVVRPYVATLLQALLSCFTDDSWPVRDAACLASGNFIHSFPLEGKDVMPQLYPLFFTNLQDSIPSVRQGAAVALGSVAEAYHNEAISIIKPVIKSRLEGIAEQSSECELYSDLSTEPATYGVAKKRRDNDIALHEDQQMYSCGSLAPKMGRGGDGGGGRAIGGGGCSDCRFRRPPQPWEEGDGAVWLMGELAMVGSLHTRDAVIDLLELLSRMANKKHYTQHLSLLETLCKNLPRICKGIDKKNFKPHLHLFIDLIFYALGSENCLTSCAASQCLTALSAEIGPNIFKGRIEEHDPSYLGALAANNYSAPF